MQRETKTITTSAGHRVVVKAYITGAENNQIKATLFEGVTTSGEEGEKPKIPMKLVLAHERKTLETVIVSFDDILEKPVDLLEALPSKEYDEAVKLIKEAAQISFQAPK